MLANNKKCNQFNTQQPASKPPSPISFHSKPASFNISRITQEWKEYKESIRKEGVGFECTTPRLNSNNKDETSDLSLCKLLNRTSPSLASTFTPPRVTVFAADAQLFLLSSGHHRLNSSPLALRLNQPQWESLLRKATIRIVPSSFRVHLWFLIMFKFCVIIEKWKIDYIVCVCFCLKLKKKKEEWRSPKQKQNSEKSRSIVIYLYTEIILKFEQNKK